MKHYKRMHSIPKRRRHHSGPPNIKLEKGHAALLKQRRMFVHKNPYAPGAHGSHAANADNIKIVSPGPGFNPPRQGWFHEKGSVLRRQAPNYTRRKRRRTKRRPLPRPITRRRRKRTTHQQHRRSPPKTLLQRFMSSIGWEGGGKSRRRRTRKRK